MKVQEPVYQSGHHNKSCARETGIYQKFGQFYTLSDQPESPPPVHMYSQRYDGQARYVYSRETQDELSGRVVLLPSTETIKHQYIAYCS